jgi:hypothetical protein
MAKKKSARKKGSATKKSTKKKSAKKKKARKSAKAALKKSHRKGTDKRWVRKVETDSTHPPPDTFKQDAETIAQTMASKKVSPKGVGSGIRMVQYFINRGGKNLPKSQKAELEKAKRLLQQRQEK